MICPEKDAIDYTVYAALCVILWEGCCRFYRKGKGDACATLQKGVHWGGCATTIERDDTVEKDGTVESATVERGATHIRGEGGAVARSVVLGGWHSG